MSGDRHDLGLRLMQGREAAARRVVEAACAYADSTAAPTDTPHEDALLDAVADYRAELTRTTVPTCEGCGCDLQVDGSCLWCETPI